MASSTTTNHFRFCDLAAELRDAIYDYLSTDIRDVPIPRHNSMTCHTTIKDGLCTEFQLVSKQFRAEYEQRQAGRSKLIVDVLSPSISPGFKIHPPQMCQCVALEVIVRGRGFGHNHFFGSEMSFQPGSVSNALDYLPNLKTAEVRVLFTRWMDPAAPKSLQKILERHGSELFDGFLEIEKVKAVKTFSADDLQDGQCVTEKDHGKLRLLGEWRRGHGWEHAP